MPSNPIVRRLLHAWFVLRRPMTLGVRVLVEDERSRILLVRHTYVPGWYLPGGGVENGQTQQQAAIRELQEEAGIVLTGSLDLVGVYWNRTASRRDHVTLFRCREWEQPEPFRPNREIAEAGFFDLSALPDETTPATQRRVEEVYGGRPASQHW